MGILRYDISMGGDFKLWYINGWGYLAMIYQWVGILSYDISMGGDFSLWYINGWDIF